jgi:hypothetical protein
MRTLVPAFAVVLSIVLTVSCRQNPVGPASLGTTDALVSALRSQGASAMRGEGLPRAMPCWSVSGQALFVNSAPVSVFEYSSAAAAERDAIKVEADGSGVATNGCAAKITWIGPPHFYKRDQLIVVYAGTDDGVLKPLEAVLGKPFASR